MDSCKSHSAVEKSGKAEEKYRDLKDLKEAIKNLREGESLYVSFLPQGQEGTADEQAEQE